MTNPEVNIEEIKTKLIEKFKNSGWSNKLKGFILSSDLDAVIKKLFELRENNKRFTPLLKNVFTAFEECKWEDLRVVIIGQDPYSGINVADGMAFSCSLTDKIQPSLRYMLNAIEETVYDGQTQDNDPNLKRWANQGVLLLNSSLTCEIDKPGTHYQIWEGFISYVLDIVNSYNTGLVFIFMGKKAQELEPMIGDQHHKIFTSHPASAAYKNDEKWDCNNCFQKTNEILIGQTGNGIKW